MIPLPLSRIRAIHTRLLATPLPTPIEPCVACRTHRAVSECTRCQARYYCSRVRSVVLSLEKLSVRNKRQRER